MGKPKIKNILLDLGGVLVKLNASMTIEKFTSLGLKGLEDPDRVMARYPFFMDYEAGKIGDHQFVSEIQKAAGKPIPPEEIIHAWNTMILDLEEDNLLLLRELRTRFMLCLLSNTNSLHITDLNARLHARYGIQDLKELFDRAYYSFELGMRKPDVEIFEHVLKDSRMQPRETMYIDDTLVHIESAVRLGIRAHHFKDGDALSRLLSI